MDYDRLRELQEKFDENPRRYFAPLANEYRKGGQPKRAIEICRTHLAQMPGHMSGQIVFGQSLFEAGEFDEARQVFERALVLDPENLIALRSLGDMSLQSGNTTEARSWYTRLLDADPKDTTVIALVQEIDEADEATPVTPQPAIPGIDADVGDQQIPWLEPPTPEQQAASQGKTVEIEPAPTATASQASSDESTRAERAVAESTAPEPANTQSSAVESASIETAGPRSEALTSAAAESSAPTPTSESGESAPSTAQPVKAAASEPPPPPMPSEEAVEYMASKAQSAQPQASPPAPPTEIAAPLGLERHYPTESETESTSTAAEALSEDEIETLGITSETPPLVSQRPDVGNPLDWTPTETPVAEAAVAETPETEPATTPAPAAAKEERAFSGASSEPFVNETMAQLYLKQGYRQLALQVYYRLSEARPNDQSLKDRIREIESAEAASKPPVEEAASNAPEAESVRAPAVEARREEPAIERPEPAAPTPRSPSIESPFPGERSRSEEAPGFDSSPIDSPPAAEPSEADSIEAPLREEPRAEPEGIAARQPSIKEFFATLGRRRPARTNNVAHQPPAPPPAPAAMELPPMAATGPAPTLDNVFAGAEVSPADSRAAARLAGAFSGAPRPSTTPRTPAVPTPRVVPRLQTQESEEDVAKFRAWLDGLTGE